MRYLVVVAVLFLAFRPAAAQPPEGCELDRFGRPILCCETDGEFTYCEAITYTEHGGRVAGLSRD